MKSNIIFIMALLVGLAGCAVTDFDQAANFNHYRTFAWGQSEVKIENPVYNSGLINKNIRATVEQEFARRGITENKKDPDFLVSYRTYTEKKQSSGTMPYYGYPYYPFRFAPFGWGWGFPYYGYYGGLNNTPRSYTEGTLIIDITDRKTDELVWRGTVRGDVENVNNLEKQIRKGVKAIMKKYPVPAQQSLQLDTKVIS